MPTMKRPPLSQECIEARIVLRVARLRELAAWTACEYWRQRKGGDALQYARPSSIPMMRRSRHNRSWSSLDDAWSGLAQLRVHTISLRDDNLPQNPAASGLLGG